MFRKLVTVDEAKKILNENLKPQPVGNELIPLSDAYNRILATDVVSPLDIPPFDRSTVDGYAVKAADTFGSEETRPVKLKLTGKVKVGEAPRAKVEKATLVEIVTGAPIPEGADAVIMVEHTELKNGAVLIHEPVSFGESIMKKGSDIRRGETALTKGTALSPYEIGMLAAVGVAKVEVHKRPKVAVFSTGAEIIEPGETLTAGKIFDINVHAISAAVAECGGEPLKMDIVQDKTDQMKASLQEALDKADMVITSGGVSVGPTDIIPKVLNQLGKPGVIVYGIAIRPGKPTTIAVIGDKPVFSLPGHPTSALLIFHLFVRPVLSSMTGRSLEPALTVNATLSERIFPSRGRRTYVTVTLKEDRSGKIVASPLSTGLSGAITTLARADGFVVVHETQQFVEEGQTVEVQLLRPSIYSSLMSKRSSS